MRGGVTVKDVGVRGGLTVKECGVRGGVTVKDVENAWEITCHKYLPQIGRCSERCCQQQEVLREQVAQAMHMAGTLDFAVARLIQVPASFPPFSFSCLLLPFFPAVFARAGVDACACPRVRSTSVCFSIRVSHSICLS